MSYKTPMGRVLGLGSAKDGVEHWWSQRLSAIAMVPLTVLAILPLGRAIGAGHEAVLATYASPWNAIVMILFLAVGFRHLQYGLQVVIEDYIHQRMLEVGLLVVIRLTFVLAVMAGTVAVMRLVFLAAEPL